jgi:hypothetical protein
MEGHRLTDSYKALKQRVTCLKTLSRRVAEGKVAIGALRRLKIDLREVLARNVMVNTPLCEILQQSWMLKRLALHQFQGDTYFFFTPRSRIF